MAGFAFGQVFSLLMTHEHDFDVIQTSESRDDRLVVSEGAVAVQLEELIEDQIQIIAGLGTLLVSRDLDNLPGIEAGIDRTLEGGKLASQPTNLFGNRRGVTPSPIFGVLRLHLDQA